MSVNWQDSTSPARLKAVEAAHVSGEFDPTVPTWSIYADLREALIYALLITGFPPRSKTCKGNWAITEDNWQQLFIRLSILEKVRGCYRVYNNGTKKSRKMFFTPAEIKSMIGLSVNAGNLTDAAFNKRIMFALSEESKSKLDQFISPYQCDIDDPYRWEKLFEPKSNTEES
jgi:hypothetical protein